MYRYKIKFKSYKKNFNGLLLILNKNYWEPINKNYGALRCHSLSIWLDGGQTEYVTLFHK